MLQRRVPHIQSDNSNKEADNITTPLTKKKKRRQQTNRSLWIIFLESLAISCILLTTLYLLTFDNERPRTYEKATVHRKNDKTDQEKYQMLQEIFVINQNENLGIQESFLQSFAQHDTKIGTLQRLLSNGKSNDPFLAKNMTAQEKAIEWMINYDEISNNKTISSTTPYTFLQRYTILLFYFSTSPTKWKECSSYLSSKCHITQKNNRFLTFNSSECNWYGIRCNRQHQIIWMDICGNSLDGTLHNEIFRFLPHLELLWLSENSLFGSIPSDISNVRNLQSLSLFHTRISSTLPEELYDLTELSSLRLYHTKISGSISTSISKLTKLSWLWLHQNHLTGTLSMTHLSHLYELTSLTLFNNKGLVVEDEDSLCVLREEYGLEHLWMDCDDAGSCRCCTKCYQRHL